MIGFRIVAVPCPRAGHRKEGEMKRCGKCARYWKRGEKMSPCYLACDPETTACPDFTPRRRKGGT